MPARRIVLRDTATDRATTQSMPMWRENDRYHVLPKTRAGTAPQIVSLRFSDGRRDRSAHLIDAASPVTMAVAAPHIVAVPAMVTGRKH